MPPLKRVAASHTLMALYMGVLYEFFIVSKEHSFAWLGALPFKKSV